MCSKGRQSPGATGGRYQKGSSIESLSGSVCDRDSPGPDGYALPVMIVTRFFQTSATQCQSQEILSLPSLSTCTSLFRIMANHGRGSSVVARVAAGVSTLFLVIVSSSKPLIPFPLHVDIWPYVIVI